MAKTGNSEKATVSKGERTAKDHAKAVGNGFLGAGEALLGGRYNAWYCSACRS